MCVYVDDAAIPWRGKLRYHLAADSLDELTKFAASIGVMQCWLHRSRRLPHYDLTGAEREIAIARGAIPVSSRKLVKQIRRAQEKRARYLARTAGAPGERGHAGSAI